MREDSFLELNKFGAKFLLGQSDIFYEIILFASLKSLNRAINTGFKKTVLSARNLQIISAFSIRPCAKAIIAADVATGRTRFAINFARLISTQLPWVRRLFTKIADLRFETRATRLPREAESQLLIKVSVSVLFFPGIAAAPRARSSMPDGKTFSGVRQRIAETSDPVAGPATKKLADFGVARGRSRLRTNIEF